MTVRRVAYLQLGLISSYDKAAEVSKIITVR